MADYVIRATTSRILGSHEEFVRLMQEGVDHYQKYINQMLDDCKHWDLPLVIVCLETSLNAIKANEPMAYDAAAEIMKDVVSVMFEKKEADEK